LDKNLVSNVIWALTGQVGYIFVGLVGTIFLGRILTPEDFGLVGIGMFFVGIFNVLVESGMAGALVRKEGVTKEDYSTIFIFNLIVSIFLGLLLVIAAPFIASFYEQKSLEPILIVLSLIIIINAFTITQNAKLVKNMKFKKRGLYKFSSLFCAVIISVILAKTGAGAWAIVAMQLMSSFFLMIILWVKEGGIGAFVFSKKSFKEMASFGFFTTLSAILNAAFDNIYQLILGKYFSISHVGYYYQAKKIQEAPDTAYKLVILQVFYSHLSKFQNKLSDFKVTYNLLAKLCAIVLGLTTCLVFIFAEEIIRVVLGEKWIDSIFYLRVLMISSFFTLQEMVNRNVFKIFNQTHKILYLELFKKSVQALSILIGIIYKDVILLLYGLIITSIISYFINFYFSRKVIDEVSKNELFNFLKIVFSSVMSTLLTYFLILYFNLDSYVKLVILPVFVILYFVLLSILNVQKLSTMLKYKTLLKK